ncbi:MAG: hypothetical protein D6702_08470 [Planctomycetota bacterium]|nr:MAG: hypothetical protein D6702_08470 [Planctomycetota bacterium]
MVAALACDRGPVPAAPPPGGADEWTAPGGDPPLLDPRAEELAAASEPLQPWPRLDLPPEAARVVPWTEAGRHLGEVVAAEGTIVATHNSGRACFLNFAEDWRGRFHGVIFASSFGEFPDRPEDWLLGRRVRLVGKVEEYRGTPQVVIEEPRQIVLLD